MYEVPHESLHAHIHYLEMQLLQPNIRQCRNELDRLLAEDFVEFGSSDRVYDKDEVVTGVTGHRPLSRHALLSGKLDLFSYLFGEVPA